MIYFAIVVFFSVAWRNQVVLARKERDSLRREIIQLNMDLGEAGMVCNELLKENLQLQLRDAQRQQQWADHAIADLYYRRN